MKKRVGKEIIIDGSYPITIRFFWEQYGKQRSGGLINGLLEKNDQSVDCDASAYIIEENSGEAKACKCVNYEKLVSDDGSIVHGGDNKGNDVQNCVENIDIDFSKMSPETKAIVFTLDLLKEPKKQLKLGKLEHMRIDIINSQTGDSIGEFSLIGIGERAIQVGTLVRQSEGWKYEPDVIELKNVKTREEMFTNINI